MFLVVCLVYTPSIETEIVSSILTQEPLVCSLTNSYLHWCTNEMAKITSTCNPIVSIGRTPHLCGVRVRAPLGCAAFRCSGRELQGALGKALIGPSPQEEKVSNQWKNGQPLVCTKLEAATLSSDQVPPLFVGVSELEYEMVSKIIALRVRVQIPLPTPPLKWVGFSQMILHQKNFLQTKL